ncbi:MAG: hypothetical protein M1358_21130 [Chloroflexi bacterium]|nr:hypothetical protein [Chloroflexota bacterium]
MSNVSKGKFIGLLVLAIALMGLVACAEGKAAAAVPTAEPDVTVKAKFKLVEGPSFSEDIQPMFNQYCVSCHGPERAENGLRLDSYEHVITGTRFGAVVIPEWPEASTLVYVLRRPASQEIAMPQHSKKLTQNRVKNIMYWIEAGALNN